MISGAIIGFSIAAPVGPIGILCIQRTLFKGRAVGLITGLGAAPSDTFYGFIVGFCLTLLSSILINQQWFLRLAGGMFLCYRALNFFFKTHRTVGLYRKSRPCRRLCQCVFSNADESDDYNFFFRYIYGLRRGLKLFFRNDDGNFASSRLSSNKASSFVFLVPSCEVVLSWMSLGETPKMPTIAGGAIAVLATYLINKNTAKED